MKRIISTAAAVVVGLAIGSGVAMMASEEGAGGGTEVSVGMQSWVNSWEHETPP